MNRSQFMDKQILGLSGSQLGGAGELFDLMNPEEEHQINGKKEEILPSYDFQPIRTLGSSPPTASTAPLSRPSWGSVDSKMASSNLKNAGILEPDELTKVSHEKEKSAYDAATVAEIDRTVKKYTDNLLHTLEGVSSRLMQLESRTHHLESSVDELKVMIGNSSGATEGKLKQLENILTEVQTVVQVLRDKQEIVEAQLQLANLQASKGDNQPQQSVEQSHQHAVPPSQPTMLPALPAPNAPPPPPPQQNPPAQLPQPQIPSVPSLPREPYFPSQAQQSEATHQQYRVPVQQPQPPPLPQHYQSSTQLPQYSQPPQPPQPVNPSPQLQSPLPQHPEESVPYMPAPQTYPPSIGQAVSFTQPPSGPPRNQYYGPNPNMYEPPTGRQGSGQPPFSTGYGAPMGPTFSDSYPYGGSPSHRSSSGVKSSPFASSAASSGGSSNYTRVPTAQILPQAQPTGSTSGDSSGNRVPIDDVVEKVATMGFSRDQVRAAVKKLTENGKSVDLNVVLDKLMNDGEIQPQKGWLGR